MPSVGSEADNCPNEIERQAHNPTSEMNVSMGGQSIAGNNGCADELTNWDGTKKHGLGV